MKTLDKIKSVITNNSQIAIVYIFLLLFISCNEDVLKEVSLSNPSTTQILATKAGYKTFITALHQAARNETAYSRSRGFDMQTGTDVCSTGDVTMTMFLDYRTTLTPTDVTVRSIWDWAYTQMIARANVIIVNANNSDLSIWSNEAEKNAVIAEAKFFRAYSYNILAILYGGVPIIDTVYESPKVDFTKATRRQVFEFAKNDLVYASRWLPSTVLKSDEGRIVKAAADHLLSEVYISLGDFDNAIISASSVINSGLYSLNTSRFGSEASKPGDAFSDLFRDNNQNRSSGNKESIYVRQIEDVTPGGIPDGLVGNINLLAWGPRYFGLLDPAGKSGMAVCDSMGRPIGWIRPSTYALYNIWKSDFKTDMRNSRFNIRRTFTYNNKSSAYYGKVVEPRKTNLDTMWYLYPTIRKIEGNVGKTTNNTLGATFVDIMIYRLAETYLLRAEAYIRKGSAFYSNAASDINIVRARAKASPVLPSDISIDYLLDERARELIVEEPRRRTLMRMGKLVERVVYFNRKVYQ